MITYIKICCIFLIINAIGTMIMVNDGEFENYSDLQLILCVVIYSIIPILNMIIAFMFIDVIFDLIGEVLRNDGDNNSKKK